MVDRSDISGPWQAYRPGDVVIALGLLTRLPLPASAFAPLSARAPARAAWAYPLVGTVIGSAGVAAAALAMKAFSASPLFLRGGSFLSDLLFDFTVIIFQCRAIRNIPHMNVLPVQAANVYDILKHDTLVVTKEAIKQIEERLK